MTEEIGRSGIARLFPLLVLLAAVGVPRAGFAHSLPEVEAATLAHEPYFEARESARAPSFTLRSAEGATVSLADFRDKVVVLNFIYASCPDECPLQSDLIARIQAMVNATPMRDRVQFVTITTDPVRDTPDVMKAYGTAHGFDLSNWVFLTSGADDPAATRDLVAQFGHRFDDTGDGLQLHGVVTHILDREGNLRANFHGLQFQPVNLVVYVNALVNAHLHDEHPEPSSWDWLTGLF